jgi:hypothetical protein
MNSTITTDTVDGNEIAHHTFTNVEFSAFFNSIFNLEVSTSLAMFHEYYFFIKYGEKVYIESKYFCNHKVRTIVISFEELQKNTYLQYHYDLSLMLSNNKHIVIQKSKYKEVSPRIYREDRFWKIDTATINSIVWNNNCYDIKNEEDLCYVNINPYDLENMEYTPQEQVPKCSSVIDQYSGIIDKIENFKNKNINALELVRTRWN